MSYAKEMLENSPGKVPVDGELVAACIEACMECSQACVACADACVGERDQAEMVACIRLDLACSDICTATERIMSRELAGDPGMGPVVLEACIKACGLCRAECEKHAEAMQHCKICAEACQRCEDACQKLLDALQGG
ncbi:four-helix bundle copper-binding protein [Rubrobacter indicoceani]|uniref:four-helix bundle copper-binding protein n=1 Tax=Rubrobacter indicoceani TaxID=2051957 RepID=UPI000E5AD4ED|nr:four-helix bundle copper-binding protein [Rubrobacter indicoceani]